MSTSQVAPIDRPRTSRADRRFMILLTAFEIGASIAVVWWVKHHGGTDFAAYSWSLIPPAMGAIIYWIKTRDVSGASIAILSFNLLSAGVAFFGSHNSKALLYKDCFVTGIIGIIFAATLVIGKPLTFYFGQRFVAGGTAEGISWWNGLWQHASFRRSQRQITCLWAAIMIAEALLKAYAIDHTSFESAYIFTQVLPIAAMALGVLLTFRIARVGRSARAA